MRALLRLVVLAASARSEARLVPALRGLLEAQPAALLRKERLEPVSRRAVLAAGTAALAPAAVGASGGATAGKTTSIPRAKLRYYDRVSGAVGAFQKLEGALADKAAAKAAAKSFFSEQDEAPLAELKSAGYLLSVAFKIDGKIPPDRIPQVKDYKAMMKDLGALQTAMSAGSTEEAKKIYAKARVSTAAYLDGVELPPLGDAVYAKEDPFAEKLEDTVK